MRISAQTEDAMSRLGTPLLNHMVYMWSACKQGNLSRLIGVDFQAAISEDPEGFFHQKKSFRRTPLSNTWSPKQSEDETKKFFTLARTNEWDDSISNNSPRFARNECFMTEIVLVFDYYFSSGKDFRTQQGTEFDETSTVGSLPLDLYETHKNSGHVRF